MSGPFKMKGHSLPGPNQKVSPVKQKIDYKAQGNVIDKRNEAITDFNKDSADMGGYTTTDSQKSQIQERKKSLADKLTFSTDSIANVNRQDRVKQTDKAFNELMGNTKSGEKAGTLVGKKAGKMVGEAAPKYASPAKNKEGKKGKKPEVTVTVTKDGSKMTRSSGGKTYKFTKNPKYNPKAKSRSSDSFSEKWIAEKN